MGGVFAVETGPVDRRQIRDELGVAVGREHISGARAPYSDLGVGGRRAGRPG